MTSQQVQYQREVTRSSGKYQKVNPCEICGKSSGVDYYSLSDCNETGKGLVTCRKCAEKYEKQLSLNLLRKKV